MKLSSHFTLEELIASDTAVRFGLDNTPNAEVIENLKRLCSLILEPLRDLVHAPVHINSGYRALEVNRKVGSKDNSQHVKGCAADIKVQGVTSDELIKVIIGAGLPYEQVIREFDQWVHVSVPNNPHTLPKRQELIIDKNGTRPYV